MKKIKKKKECDHRAGFGTRYGDFCLICGELIRVAEGYEVVGYITEAEYEAMKKEGKNIKKVSLFD